MGTAWRYLGGILTQLDNGQPLYRRRYLFYASEEGNRLH